MLMKIKWVIQKAVTITNAGLDQQNDIEEGAETDGAVDVRGLKGRDRRLFCHNSSAGDQAPRSKCTNSMAVDVHSHPLAIPK